MLMYFRSLLGVWLKRRRRIRKGKKFEREGEKKERGVWGVHCRQRKGLASQAKQQNTTAEGVSGGCAHARVAGVDG